jgi:transcriptional regulator with XRE-family HTH domain
LSTAGQKLRNLREQLGFTIRDVEAASVRIAESHHNDDFSIPLSRLSDIETKGVTPSIYRLYTLSVVYRRDLREILTWYGIDVNVTGSDLHLAEPPNSHTSTALESTTLLQVPMALDPGFDSRRTMNLSRMIQQWGLVPVTYLSQMLPGEFTYGYVGSEDFTMYPLILPGTFVQIDEKKSKLEEGPWRSEYERPIYFVETREGFVCSWCSITEDKLILQPHPLSPAPPRAIRHPQDAEILGQVVGIAMRLGDWKPLQEPVPVRSTREALT